MDKPRVKPLVWEDFDGRGAKAAAWRKANYLITGWSDGRFQVVESYPGYQGDNIGAGFYPTLEAAKAAAQADYEARILAALEPAPVNSDYLTVLSDKQFEDFARAVDRTEQKAPVSVQEAARVLLDADDKADQVNLTPGLISVLRALAGDEGDR